jgi:chromosome segregation ATPase
MLPSASRTGIVLSIRRCRQAKSAGDTMNPIIDIEAFTSLMERIAEKILEKTGQIDTLSGEIDLLNKEKQELLRKFDSADDMRKRLEAIASDLNQTLESLGESAEESTPQKTNYVRIEDFFLLQNNVAATIAQIEEGTQIGRSSISAVLYRTHANKFIVNERSGNQANTWRLSGYEFANTESSASDDDTHNSGGNIPF